MGVLCENTIIGASGAGGYTIDQSLRFNDDDSAYLSRTPSSTGNRKTWTFSCWIKRCKLGTEQEILVAKTGGDQFVLKTNNDTIQFFDVATSFTTKLTT